MKQYHHPKDRRTYDKGANFDTDKEFTTIGQGQYIDARNMRNMSMDSTNGAIKKIGGEELIYPNINNNCIDGDDSPMAATYSNIGTCVVNGNIVEFWADEEGVLPSYVRINGQIVLLSADFPITYPFPLQIDVNESCIGGEIYVTDFNVEPMIFNALDLMNNSGMTDDGVCSEKYFADFNIDLYRLSLSRAVNHPVFIKLDASTGGYTNVLYGLGLPVGYYTYSYRFATAAGDRTQWSPPTDMIPVVKRLTSGNEPHFPHLQTISKPADISSPSIYGAHIKLRIDNSNDYDFIELRRDSWYAEDALGSPPVMEIIARIDVNSGELSVRDILDQGKAAEEVVSGDEAIEVLASIKKAKTVRYFNNTLYLMNVEYESMDISGDLVYNGGSNAMFPVIHNMGVRGHGEPYNGASFKSLMRHETYGWATILWDSQGNWSYADEIPGFESYELPSRRDTISTLTEDISYYGTVRAADTDGNVSQTHEVFDLIDATAKEDGCDYKNIFSESIFGNITGTAHKSDGEVNYDVSCPTAADDGFGVTVTGSELGYRPFYPTNQDDTNIDSLDYKVNYKVENSGAASDYNPAGFSPRYFSMGMALNGVSGFPSWAKAFSVVRTAPAEKISAQGIGFYKLRSADGEFGANTSKDPYEFWLYLPDADDNYGINNSLVDSLLSDFEPYGLELASPLGFFTEVYSFDDAVTGDIMADVVTWCRLLNDGEGSNARINPDENPDMGILDATTLDRFVAYGKWRATSQFSPQHTSGDNGNFLYDIDDVEEITKGRSKYLRIRTTQPIYTQEYSNGEYQGDEPDVQNWHEPIYMVNIVKRNAVVPNNNTTQFKYCGNYVKLDSLIGVSSYDDTNSYSLVDERWEDCIPVTVGDNGGYYSGLNRFCFIEDTNGGKLRWLNVNEFSNPQITTILTDITDDGFYVATDASGSYNVYGVYTSTESNDGVAKTFSLNFDYFNVLFAKGTQVPALGSKVLVSYDNRIPVRVFGGDTWIGDNVCAWQDNEYDKGGDPVTAGDNFKLNVAFPYRKYHVNPRMFIVKRSKDSGVLLGSIQQQDKFRFQELGVASAQIRQLVSNFICETRVNLNYAFNNEDPKHSSDQWFPLKNYVMRPNRWDDSLFANEVAADVYEDNNIYAEYENDYGSEYLLWQYGGLRFINLATATPMVNLDYSQTDDTKTISSTPELGFTEQNKYCTRVCWSVKRPVNIQDSPTVRTFPSNNTYDISDDSGEIKKAFSSISAKGNNLYAFTEKGVCLLLVDKRIIHEINASELATVGSDIGGILNELWISRDIGLNGESWRSGAEFNNIMWFVNNKSAYKFIDNELVDIGRAGYHSKLYPYFLSNMSSDYTKHLTGVYDELHNEYWVNFGGHVLDRNMIPSPTLVWGDQQEMWQGGFDYNFDRYVTIDNETYGIKNAGTYLLNSGNEINGVPIISELIGVCAGDVAYEDRAPSDNRFMDKEFLRIRVNSNFKPNFVDFYDNFEQYLVATAPEAQIDNSLSPNIMKDYFGYEGYIPRKLIIPNFRMQGRLVIYNIINTFDEGFKISSTEIQYKKLK